MTREEVSKILQRLKMLSETERGEMALDIAISLVENEGEWKMPAQDDGTSDPIYYQVRCSKCGFDLDPQTWYEELHQFNADNFCPNCGANMRGK